jgi:crotonobetainyl-CoA hydratase
MRETYALAPGDGVTLLGTPEDGEGDFTRSGLGFVAVGCQAGGVPITDGSVTPPAAGPLLVERRGAVGLLTLNRPHVHNAVNADMATAFGAALERFDTDPDVRVIVIHGGTAKSFCSGADLKEVAGGTTPNARGHEEWGFLGLVKHFVSAPIIAAVNGPAYAGGVELLLACDLVVAASDVRFVFTEIEHGLFASMGGTVRLSDHVPRKIAFEWLIAPSEIDMSAALAWGLVNRVVPPGEELGAALALADRIAALPPAAVRACKRAFYGAVRGEPVLETQHWLVSDAEWLALRNSPVGQDGPRAFAAKRRLAAESGP